MKGKCNCGKKATSEWMINFGGAGGTIYFCDKCKPKFSTDKMYRIDK